MEDFVPFEFAKKLKEKGFEEKCLTYYDVEDNVGLLYNTQYTDEALPCQYTDLLQCHNTGEAETQPDDSEDCVDAPTISQALKWLREEKKIHIAIGYSGETKWRYVVIHLDEAYFYMPNITKKRLDSYEEAALAGIGYTLNELI